MFCLRTRCSSLYPFESFARLDSVLFVCFALLCKESPLFTPLTDSHLSALSNESTHEDSKLVCFLHTPPVRTRKLEPNTSADKPVCVAVFVCLPLYLVSCTIKLSVIMISFDFSLLPKLPPLPLSVSHDVFRHSLSQRVLPTWFILNYTNNTSWVCSPDLFNLLRPEIVFSGVICRKFATTVFHDFCLLVFGKHIWLMMTNTDFGFNLENWPLGSFAGRHFQSESMTFLLPAMLIFRFNACFPFRFSFCLMYKNSQAFLLRNMAPSFTRHFSAFLFAFSRDL